MSRFLKFATQYIIIFGVLVSFAFSQLVHTQTAHSETRKGDIERLALTKHTTTGLYYVSIPTNFNAAQEKSYEIYTALIDYLVANNLAYILEVQGPDARTGSPKLSSSQEFGNLFKAYENSIPSNYSHPDYSPFYTLPDIPNESIAPIIPVTPTLSVIPGEQSVSVWAGNLIFRIINTSGGIMNWTASVTSGSSWLSIADVTAGVNNGTMNEKTIMVRFLQNNGPFLRTAEVTVIAPDATGSPKIIKITQAGSTIIFPIPIKEPQLAPLTSILSVTPSNKNISAMDAGHSGFNVTNIGGGTMNWTASVTSGSSWLSISSGASGVNNELITVQHSQNNGPSPRTAEITVIAPGATGNPKVVTITQAGSVIISPVPNTQEEKVAEQERIRRLEAERQQQKDQRKIDEQIRAQEAAEEALKKAKNDEEQRTAEEARKKVEEVRVTAEQEAQKHQQEEALRKAQEEQKQAEEQHKAQTAAEEAKRKEQQPTTSASPQISNPSPASTPYPQSIMQPQNTSNISEPVPQQPTPKISVSISASEPATDLNSPVTIKWNSTNAISCNINGDARPLSGFLTETLKASKKYILSCANNNGTATDEVSVGFDSLSAKEITELDIINVGYPIKDVGSQLYNLVADYNNFSLTKLGLGIAGIIPGEKLAISLIKPVASTVWKVASTITKTGAEAVATKGVIRELATGVQKFFDGIGEKISKVLFKNTDEATTVVSKVTVSNVANLADEVVEFNQDVWLKNWSKRGKIIDLGLGNNLGSTFKGVDILENRTVVSIKSMDINAPTYKTASNIGSTLKKYVNGVRDFAGYKHIKYGKNFENRALKLAIPDTTLTQEQISVIKEVKDYAKSLDIGFTITVVK